MDAARREALRVALELLEALLDEPELVGGVVDREVRAVAEPRASRRRMRPQAAWNVITQAARAGGPTRSSSRSRISAAALFVNVIARISVGFAPTAASRCAIRRVRTRVFPEPAPAITSSGPSVVEHGLALGRIQVVEVRLGRASRPSVDGTTGPQSPSSPP